MAQATAFHRDLLMVWNGYFIPCLVGGRIDTRPSQMSFAIGYRSVRFRQYKLHRCRFVVGMRRSDLSALAGIPQRLRVWN